MLEHNQARQETLNSSGFWRNSTCRQSYMECHFKASSRKMTEWGYGIQTLSGIQRQKTAGESQPKETDSEWNWPSPHYRPSRAELSKHARLESTKSTQRSMRKFTDVAACQTIARTNLRKKTAQKWCGKNEIWNTTTSPRHIPKLTRVDTENELQKFSCSQKQHFFLPFFLPLATDWLRPAASSGVKLKMK